MIDRLSNIFKNFSLFVVVLASSTALANTNETRESIQTIEDMVKYVGLSEVYVCPNSGTEGMPGFFIPVNQFKMQSLVTHKEDGTTTENLDSFAYYIKYGRYQGRPTNYVSITAQNFKDEMALAGGDYICLFDEAMKPPYGPSTAADSIAKYDVLAINQEDPKRQSLKELDIDSLTPEQARQEIFQFSKGFRHAFLGGSVNNPGGWPDVLVNQCSSAASGVDSTTGLWNPMEVNIHTLSSGDSDDLYVEWINPEDKEAGKKADYVYLRGLKFEKAPNPKLGTGLIHNADILLKLYHKAGMLSDEQFENEMLWYETQSN